MAEQIKSIEIYILAGLQKRIKEVFGFDISYKLTVDPLLQPDGSRLTTYPVPYLRLNSIRHRNEEESAIRGIEKRWHYGTSSQDHNMVRAYRFLNVAFVVEFNVISNNYDDIAKVMNTWMFSYRQNALNYTIVYDGIGVDVKVMANDDIQVPYKDEGFDERSEFEFQANLEIWGYMSQMVEVNKDVAKTVTLQFGIEGAPQPEYEVSFDWEDPFQ